MIIVASALIGPTESIGPAPPAPQGVRFVCYTDRRDLNGWQPLPAPAGHPRLAARRAKMRVLDDFPGHEFSIWVDASFDLLCDPRALVREAVATGCDVVGLRHPDRRRIRDEAREVIRLGLAPKDLVTRQLEAYQLAGFDCDDAPRTVITTTGLMVRRHTQAVQAFTHRWHDELEQWTIRDQLSVDYAAWRTGVAIGYLPGHYRDNRFALYNRVRHRERRVTA